MFIKLSRLDNRPIWLNASFIVTVEPRREGSGSVVVPIGDGLDYDVRESPSEVLRLLDGAPAPAVVPVPVSDCLTPTPEDVSPDPEPKDAGEREVPPPASDSAPKAEAKPKKRAPRAKAKTSAASAAKTKAAEVAPPPKAELELSPAEVDRLRKLAPKSMGKLRNTLATQFKLADVNANVEALVQKGVVAFEGNRVLWKAEEV